MEQRTYNQYCATARTLDLIGERWTLLLVRELLTGPKRFRDLLANLPGLGTGLLAARLKHLEGEGLIRRTTLPPPARTPAYDLTEAGRELGPTVLAMARWGMKWAMDNRRPAETFRSGWAMLGLQACFSPDAAAGLRAVIEFRIDEETFHARVHDGTVDMVHTPAQAPDATVTIDGATFLSIAEGHTTLADALSAGTATTVGAPWLLRKLPRLFRQPSPVPRNG
ncbi:winged helix-turn-helix transcriptional regulator [Nonomuraea sp. B10E15]|uniref:winged helix-turn-helix transcriptional regulator n=1 Tax=Nonomuraea sp. B10E15 TaxID=3153560 RepID=UPI00325C815B